MLTEAQANHIITMLDSEMAHDLFESVDHDRLAQAIYARNPEEDSVSDAFKAELGGAWTDTFREYERVLGKTRAEFEFAAFLRGLVAGIQLGPLCSLVPDLQPAVEG